jgi:hypothetical protein
MLGPYTMLRLVVGVLGGVVVFHELPDVLSACGAVVILASCVFSSGVAINWRRSYLGKIAALATASGALSVQIASRRYLL